MTQPLRFFIPALLYQQVGQQAGQLRCGRPVAGAGQGAQPVQVPPLGQQPVEQGRRFWARWPELQQRRRGPPRRLGDLCRARLQRGPLGGRARRPARGDRRTAIRGLHRARRRPDVIVRGAGPDARIYADPPYPAQTRTGRTRSPARRLLARARRRRPPGTCQGAARHRRGGARLRPRLPALRRAVRRMAPHPDPGRRAQRPGSTCHRDRGRWCSPAGGTRRPCRRPSTIRSRRPGF